MSKKNGPHDAPKPDGLTHATPAGGAVEAAVNDIVHQQPDAISFDTADPVNELLHLRCLCDPGIAAQLKDGWKGDINGWHIGTWTITDETSGELVTLPSLVLLTTKGELVRLTGWPCVSSFATLLKAAGADRIRAGLTVTIKRRQSGTAGRSYWLVLPGA